MLELRRIPLFFFPCALGPPELGEQSLALLLFSRPYFFLSEPKPRCFFHEFTLLVACPIFLTRLPFTSPFVRSWRGLLRPSLSSSLSSPLSLFSQASNQSHEGKPIRCLGTHLFLRTLLSILIVVPIPCRVADPLSLCFPAL